MEKSSRFYLCVGLIYFGVVFSIGLHTMLVVIYLPLFLVRQANSLSGQNAKTFKTC